MNEIKCPKCGTVFQINETDYESIVRQIRNQEFASELASRQKEFEKEKARALELTEAQLEKKFHEVLSQKEMEISELKNTLKGQETEKELAVQNAVSEKEKTINTLSNQIELKETEYLLKEKNLKESYEEKIKNKDEQIAYYKDFKAKQSTKMIGESLEQHCHNEFN